jgi:hypothetical protein
MPGLACCHGGGGSRTHPRMSRLVSRVTVRVDATLHQVRVDATLYQVRVDATLHQVRVDATLYQVRVDATLYQRVRQ